MTTTTSDETAPVTAPAPEPPHEAAVPEATVSADAAPAEPAEPPPAQVPEPAPEPTPVVVAVEQELPMVAPLTVDQVVQLALERTACLACQTQLVLHHVRLHSETPDDDTPMAVSMLMFVTAFHAHFAPELIDQLGKRACVLHSDLLQAAVLRMVTPPPGPM